MKDTAEVRIRLPKALREKLKAEAEGLGVTQNFLHGDGAVGKRGSAAKVGGI